jgi:hypothetical protein
MSQLLIPFEPDGSVPNQPLPDCTYEWLENFNFCDTLLFEDYCRGSSRCGFVVRSSGNATYYMFLRDALDALRQGSVDHGRIHGWWTFVRRGVAFGVRLMPDSER